MNLVERSSLFAEGTHPDPFRKITRQDDRRDGWSTAFMPDRAQLCIPNSLPWEVALQLTKVWAEAWVKYDLREWQGQPHEGNYYCRCCRCRKSGDWQEPNSHDPGCEDFACLCHEETE